MLVGAKASCCRLFHQPRTGPRVATARAESGPDLEGQQLTASPSPGRGRLRVLGLDRFWEAKRPGPRFFGRRPDSCLPGAYGLWPTKRNTSPSGTTMPGDPTQSGRGGSWSTVPGETISRYR